MDPVAVQLAIALINLTAKALVAYPQLRAAATTEDRAELDAAYKSLTAQSNHVADVLRDMPDDPF